MRLAGGKDGYLQSTTTVVEEDTRSVNCLADWTLMVLDMTVSTESFDGRTIGAAISRDVGYTSESHSHITMHIQESYVKFTEKVENMFLTYTNLG